MLTIKPYAGRTEIDPKIEAKARRMLGTMRPTQIFAAVIHEPPALADVDTPAKAALRSLPEEDQQACTRALAEKHYRRVLALSLGVPGQENIVETMIDALRKLGCDVSDVPVTSRG